MRPISRRKVPIRVLDARHCQKCVCPEVPEERCWYNKYFHCWSVQRALQSTMCWAFLLLHADHPPLRGPDQWRVSILNRWEIVTDTNRHQARSDNVEVFRDHGKIIKKFALYETRTRVTKMATLYTTLILTVRVDELSMGRDYRMKVMGAKCKTK